MQSIQTEIHFKRLQELQIQPEWWSHLFGLHGKVHYIHHIHHCHNHLVVARPSPSSPSLRPPSSSRSPSSHGGWWPRRKDIGLRTVYSIQYTATTCASTKHNGPPHHTLTTIHLSKPRPPRAVVPRGIFGVPAIGMKNSDICFCKTKLRNTETCRCHCTMPPPLLVDGRWTWSLAAHRCSSWSRLLHKSDDMNKHIHARYTGSAQPCLVRRSSCCGTNSKCSLCGAKPHWAPPKENRENEKVKKWEKRSIKHAHHAPWPPAIPNGREGPSNGHCTRSRPGNRLKQAASLLHFEANRTKTKGALPEKSSRRNSCRPPCFQLKSEAAVSKPFPSILFRFSMFGI